MKLLGVCPLNFYQFTDHVSENQSISDCRCLVTEFLYTCSFTFCHGVRLSVLFPDLIQVNNFTVMSYRTLLSNYSLVAVKSGKCISTYTSQLNNL